jgi:capsular exopolysaccharide synthesis family protein
MYLPQIANRQQRMLEPAPPAVALPLYGPAPTHDFLQTVRKLFRHRWLIIACTLAFAAATFVVVKVVPARYVAEARVLVGVPMPKVLTLEAIVNDEAPDADRIQNEALVVQSRALAGEVIDQQHLADDPEFNPSLKATSSGLLAEWAHWRSWIGGLLRSDGDASAGAESARDPRDLVIDALLAKLSVNPLGRSHVLSIQAEAHTADKAAAIANAFAERYLEAQRSDKVSAAARAEKFFDERIAELRQRVERAEQAVENYRRENGLYRGTNAGVTSQELTELNTQLILAQTAMAEADARYRDAQANRRNGATGESVPDVLRSQLIQSLKGQEADAERKVAELASTYGNRHPLLITARAELADIRHKIRTEIATTIEGLRHEAQATQARYAGIKRDFDRLKTEMGEVNEQSIHLEALERDATAKRTMLENMLGRAQEIAGAQQIQQANAKLVSPAAPPEAPGFPQKSLLMVLGTLGGGLVGVLGALFRESMDRTFRRGDEIEALTGLPVLSLVPSLKGVSIPAMHVLRQPISPYSEALRKLYIGLQLSEAAQSPKTALISSATPGEGKSVLVASMGRMLASNGRRVLLIDCDWRSPTLHRLFRCPNRGGLAALLDDNQVPFGDIVHNDGLSGADVIVAGEMTMKSMHLLTSERMQLILRELAKRYDIVLLDSAPVLVAAEVLTLSRFVDKVIFGVRWGSTHREAALDGLRQIVEARGDVAGTVLLRVDRQRYREYAYGHLNYEYARAMAGHA